MKTIAQIHPAVRRALLGGVALLLVGIAACDDPFAPKAYATNVERSYLIWSMTGSPAAYPSVLVVAQRYVIRPDPAGSFDLGFDLDATGRVRVLPVNKIIESLSGPRPIGMIRATEPYADITEAPRNGWAIDSIFTLDVGDSFIVKVQTLFCSGSYSSEIYAKYRVDSVIPAESRIVLTGLVNPNCGFRSFAAGIPTF